jgi:hypothetical protein
MMPMSRDPHILSSFAPLLAWAVLLTTNGCAGAETYWSRSVMTSFVGAESCPAERVTVERTTRPDWLTAPPAPPVPPPPPEVAADPARLKVYNDEHAPPPDPHANHTFFVGKGCEHVDVYECTIELAPNASDPTNLDFQCSPVARPATAGAR